MFMCESGVVSVLTMNPCTHFFLKHTGRLYSHIIPNLYAIASIHTYDGLTQTRVAGRLPFHTRVAAGLPFHTLGLPLGCRFTLLGCRWVAVSHSGCRWVAVSGKDLIV